MFSHSQPTMRPEIEKLVMGTARSYPLKIIFPVLSGINGNNNKYIEILNNKLHESDKLNLILSQVLDMK